MFLVLRKACSVATNRHHPETDRQSIRKKNAQNITMLYIIKHNVTCTHVRHPYSIIQQFIIHMHIFDIIIYMQFIITSHHETLIISIIIIIIHITLSLIYYYILHSLTRKIITCIHSTLWHHCYFNLLYVCSISIYHIWCFSVFPNNSIK